MATVVTGIESKILERDDSVCYIDKLDEYLDKRLFILADNLDFGAYYLICGHESDAREWMKEEWDLIKPLYQPAQLFASDSGYGKI